MERLRDHFQGRTSLFDTYPGCRSLRLPNRWAGFLLSFRQRLRRSVRTERCMVSLFRKLPQDAGFHQSSPAHPGRLPSLKAVSRPARGAVLPPHSKTQSDLVRRDGARCMTSLFTRARFLDLTHIRRRGQSFRRRLLNAVPACGHIFEVQRKWDVCS